MEEYHPPVEEYLETVHALAEEGTPVIGARIAERLGRSAPSVSQMLDRLEEGGYVRREGRLVELTDSGSQLAEKVVRRHRLAERLLVDVIGLEWHKVHAEAGRWEHVISDDVEEKLVELLGDPGTCPHGNPIPGSSAPVDHAPQQPLSEVPAGSTVRLARISEEVELDIGSLAYLDEHRFVPGASATVSERATDGTIRLELVKSDSGSGARDRRGFSVGPDLSRRLFVAAV